MDLESAFAHNISILFLYHLFVVI